MGKMPEIWKVNLIAALFISLAIYFTVQAVQAAGVDPGSSQDPLVTKSYVDNYIDNRVRELQAQLDGINRQINVLEAKIAGLEQEQKPAPGRAPSSGAPIRLIIGNRLAWIGDSSRELPVAPYQTPGGTSMVPFRFIGEALGAQVDYDSASRTVSYTTQDHSVILKIGSTTGTIDGRQKSFPAPAALVENTTMVPVRVISEGLGADVSWDQVTWTITITP